MTRLWAEGQSPLNGSGVRLGGTRKRVLALAGTEAEAVALYVGLVESVGVAGLEVEEEEGGGKQGRGGDEPFSGQRQGLSHGMQQGKRGGMGKKVKPVGGVLYIAACNCEGLFGTPFRFWTAPFDWKMGNSIERKRDDDLAGLARFMVEMANGGDLPGGVLNIEVYELGSAPVLTVEAADL